jgi:hypothetical protein
VLVLQQQLLLAVHHTAAVPDGRQTAAAALAAAAAAAAAASALGSAAAYLAGHTAAVMCTQAAAAAAAVLLEASCRSLAEHHMLPGRHLQPAVQQCRQQVAVPHVPVAVTGSCCTSSKAGGNRKLKRIWLSQVLSRRAIADTT